MLRSTTWYQSDLAKGSSLFVFVFVLGTVGFTVDFLKSNRGLGLFFIP